MNVFIPLALVFLPETAWAFNCQISPIYVDAHLRTTHPDDLFEYGSFIGFGSPAQNQSIWPSITDNETSVADTNFCSHSNFTNCLNNTGGSFDISQSTSWVNSPNYQSQNVEPQSPDEGIFGQDTIHLYTHYFESDPAWDTPFTNMPLRVVTNGSDRPDIVGLGPQSTLLQKLYASNMISSRSYGFYLGTGFDRAHGVINGSTVFGGYDAGRFTGPVYNYTLGQNTGNPFQVRVSSITLNDPSGIIKNVDLITDSGFEAQISTDQYPMSFPSDVTQKFISTLAAEPTDSDDGSLRITKPFNGTMNITLSNGFSISLAPEVVANVSGISPVHAPRSDNTASGPFILGGSWLSQVYLMVNYDDQSFHLAQALPEAKFIVTKTMCPHVVPTPYIPPSVGFVSGGLVGAVIGGVIGGSAIATVAICSFLSWRRRSTRKRVRYFDGKKGGVKIYQFEIEDDRSDEESRQPLRKIGRSTRKL